MLIDRIEKIERNQVHYKNRKLNEINVQLKSKFHLPAD